MIDPRVGFWISLIAAILGALISGGALLTDVLGPDLARLTLGILGIANVIVNAVNIKVNASRAGPLATRLFRLKPRS